jgi:hypothetical protein
LQTDAIIVDMDGTLCDVSSVRHYVTGEQRNFRAFHEASRFCPPHPVVERIVRAAHRADVAVVIVTARDARFEGPTLDFLVRHDIPFDALFMRPWGDQRRDTAVKHDIHASVIAAGFRPVFAIDDREDIATVWESHGIPTVLVPSDDAPG